MFSRPLVGEGLSFVFFCLFLLISLSFVQRTLTINNCNQSISNIIIVIIIMIIIIIIQCIIIEYNIFAFVFVLRCRVCSFFCCVFVFLCECVLYYTQ